MESRDHRQLPEARQKTLIIDRIRHHCIREDHTRSSCLYELRQATKRTIILASLTFSKVTLDTLYSKLKNLPLPQQGKQRAPA